MKVRINMQHSRAMLAIIVALACLNIQPFTATAQSITTASAPSQYPGSLPKPLSYSAHPMGNGMNMEDIPSDQYWKLVEGEPFKFTGKVRTYYIASDEVIWDYAPDGYDKAHGRNWTELAAEYTVASETRVGSKYFKCLYREYTDSKFTKLKPRAKEEEYLGFLGPVIRAEVGDIIKVVYLNRCRFPASVRPHGVFYDKANEGDAYNDGTTGNKKFDEEVLPGKSFTYTWNVPERCGPGPMDGSSVMWMYHSRTMERGEFYAGLHGPMAITRKGMAKADGSPLDVDYEIFQMYSVSNENNSPYLADSFAKFSKAGPNATLPTDQGFVGSNQMHGINGYLYGNGPWVTMKKNDRARWYLMSMGTFFDGHTPHWHGNTVLTAGMRMDVVSTLAAEMVIADMCPENVGLWLYHCHVNDHLEEGMVSVFEVTENNKKKAW